MKIGIVVADFNGDITSKMLNYALKKAKSLRVSVAKIIHVPGSYDTPLAVKHLLKRKEIDAAVLLGAVIKGGTDHDEIVAENAARCAADLALKYNKPVALGISGPDMTKKQAIARAKPYAERAVEGAVRIVKALR